MIHKREECMMSESKTHNTQPIINVKLNEIENLQIPDFLPNSNRIDAILVQCITEAITCIISEYAVNELKYDISDEMIYPFIRRYFEGEIKAKDLLKKLLSNSEISEFFNFIPKFENIKFNVEEWRNTLNSISISSSSTTNDYHIGVKHFNSEKCFFNILQKNGRMYAQKYNKDLADGNAYFLTLGNDEEVTFIKKPFMFSVKKNVVIDNDLPNLTDEEFFNIDEIKSTDEDQRNAISETTEKNLVILAGAGSGKTRTLVSRLAYLHLVKRVPLSKIVLLTFTKAAANEMQNRAESLINNIYLRTNCVRHPNVNAKTFDAFFRRIVLDYFAEIGFTEKPKLELEQDDETIKKKCNILQEVVLDNQMQGIFSNFLQEKGNSYNDLLNVIDDYAMGLTINLPGVDKLLDLFLDKQIENNTILSFLYVNLIVKRALYQEKSILKQQLSMRFSDILIDEFQDISTLQNETLKLFYDTKMHFTFVGDDDQSIYAWRGADVSIIQDIKNKPNTITRSLLTNYRNNPNIVKAGNCILRLIDNRAKKNEIKPYKTTGAKIRISKSDDQYKNVVDEIDTIIKSGCEAKEISVLARKKSQVDFIKTALEAIHIPVVTQEIAINKRDTYYVMLKALINIHSDYELSIACLHIKQLTKEYNTPEELIYKIIQNKKSCAGNLKILQQVSKEVFAEKATLLSTIVDRFVEKAGEVFERIIYGKLENRTLEAFSDYCKNCEAPWPISHEQLRSIYLSFEKASNRNRRMNKKMTNGVSVSTIHHAKGLEYNVVMIVGLNSGEYPNIGLIDSQYNKKVQELERLKDARNQYYELRKNMTDIQIEALLDDCNNNILDKKTIKKFAILAKYIKSNQRRLKQLNADAISGFLELYNHTIVPLERDYKYEQAEISKTLSEYESLLEVKQEELSLLKDIDIDNKKLKQKECNEIEVNISIQQNLLRSKKYRGDLFNKAISNLKSFNTKGFIVSGLLADMSRTDEIETIKEKLEKERKARIDEERRTFYVAVTRARDQLYLFSDKGANESEFINDIDDDLKTKYTALTKNERNEFERLAGGLRNEFKNNVVDEEAVNLKIENIVKDSHFRKYIEFKLKEYRVLNPYCKNLPKEANNYFIQGMSLLFVGELTGVSFSTEFAHNIQRSAECLLEYTAGITAIPFTTMDRELIAKITKKIRDDAKICTTQIPSKKFIEDILLPNNKNKVTDSLKKTGIEHYIVRSHNFRIASHIFHTWKKNRINGDSRIFLKSVVDLANIRNVLVHEKEDCWPEDAVTKILNSFKYIIKCCN